MWTVGGKEGRAQLLLVQARPLMPSSTFPSHNLLASPWLSGPQRPPILSTALSQVGFRDPLTEPFTLLTGLKAQRQQGAKKASTQRAGAEGRLEGGRSHAGRAWGPRNPWENARTLGRKQIKGFTLAPRGPRLLTHHVMPTALSRLSQRTPQRAKKCEPGAQLQGASKFLMSLLSLKRSCEVGIPLQNTFIALFVSKAFVFIMKYVTHTEE